MVGNFRMYLAAGTPNILWEVGPASEGLGLLKEAVCSNSPPEWWKEDSNLCLDSK